MQHHRLSWLHLLTTIGALTMGTALAADRRQPKRAALPDAQAGSGRRQVPILRGLGDGSLTADLPDAKLATPPSQVTPLSPESTAGLLRRLEPLPELSERNRNAPPLRAATAAPPRSGTAQAIPFVVPSGRSVADGPIRPMPPKKASKPLVPPQISPQGEVIAESEVRIRFDEPMVPVARVGVTSQPPATITPQVAGTWRWIDSRVLVFAVAKGRLPGATEFRVTVPAGTKALSEAKLAEDFSADFRTSPVQIVAGFPSGAIRPDSPIVVTFDQVIDAKRILPFLRVDNSKGKALPWKAITLAKAKPLWKRNPSIDFNEAAAGKSLGPHHVILAPVAVWPSGSIMVTLQTGAPSEEGPNTTTGGTATRFDVAPPFRAIGLSCANSHKPRMTGAVCPALGWLSAHFSNPVDPTSYRSSKVQIEGEPFDDHGVNRDSVSMIAPRAVGRVYTIGLADGLMDVYGQPLTGDRRLSFTTRARQHDSSLSASTGLQVLDPRFQIPQWVIHVEAVESLRVQLFQVEPKDYFAYQNLEARKRTTPPGRRLFDKEYAIGAHHGAEIRVDLRPALHRNGLGHVIALATVSHTGQPPSDALDFDSLAWIQVTKLGISARLDKEKVNGWIQDITPDKLFAPIAGATASLLVDGRPDLKLAATSDREGHVVFDLAPKGTRVQRQDGALLVAEAKGDSTFTALSSFEKTIRKENALWYVTDDRFLYKPDEKVYLKGWLRWTHDGVNPDLTLPATGEEVAYALHDAQGLKIAAGTAQLTGQGGFDLEVKLPPNVGLGNASFEFTTRKSHHRHPISIQEFRTPAYAVTLNDDVSHAGATPLILGESIEMSATAKYYAGGGLAGAAIHWEAKLEKTWYRPPGWDLFSFTYPGSSTYGQTNTAIQVEKQGTLDSASSANVVFAIPALSADQPGVLKVDATVTDLDRMSIRASSRSILVHPSAYYVGVRLKQDKDSAEVLELVVTDIDGNAVRGVPIEVEWKGVLGSESQRDDAKVVHTQGCTRTSAATPVTCPFKPINAMTAYTATATVADGRGRKNLTQYRIPWYPARDTEVDFAVVPDKAKYRVGDTAKLHIRSTVLPATAVVTFARQGVIAQKRIDLVNKSTIVDLPIEPGYIQNVFVVVDRYGKRRHEPAEDRAPLPEHSEAEVELPVSMESALLSMKTRPMQPLVEPGDEATFEVIVEHEGKPLANAEVALMVVDEAILSLAGRDHENPLLPFYRYVHQGTTHHTSIDRVQDAGDDLEGTPGIKRYRLDEGLGMVGMGLGGGGTGEGTIGLGNFGTIGRGGGVVAARKDFRANAAFSPRLKTDDNGRVRLAVKMPDSLTRFRIVALASAGTYLFGKAEGVIVTQRKLNARTIAPRFLTQGDRFSLPVLVQNLDTRPRTVDVAVRAANLVGRGPAGKRVTIPGGQRAEVRFDFATKTRGQAVVQTIASSGDFADASNVEFPVYEPATTQSFATYGTVDDATKFEQLVVPDNVFQDVGGVEVSLASTELQSLTDAYWYLYAYPYECAEQRSSRMLATAALDRILDAFQTPGRPTRKEIDEMRSKDIRLLSKDQLPDGGWGFFPGMKSDPFVTMQVVQALGAVHRGAGAKAMAYVNKQAKSLMAELDKATALPTAQQPRGDRLSYAVSLAATALLTLAGAGEDVGARAEHLHQQATRLAVYPMDAKARLLALVAKQERHKAMRTRLLGDILSATHETASAATVTTSYQESERLLLVSSNKTTALALHALLLEAPNHALVSKLARGVLDGRRHGRWSSTQENLVVLQALRLYFDTFEKAEPHYTGKLWFGSQAYAEQAFLGRSNVRGQATLDWNTLVPGSTHDLALAKDGTGRMYYRVGITYAPREPHLPALDAGFVVRRSYSAVDDPADVKKLADGRWRIRLGAKILVTVEASNTSKRYNVALVDPLPAGFETVNENLATAERAVHARDDSFWDYQNLRDNRSEAFALSMDEGRHQFSYTVRATTPGTFIAAPAKAEEMYSPETFGSSTGEIVEIAEP
jgi:uncharacterized protein YfaS (alpha-2-macroglobulin family)